MIKKLQWIFVSIPDTLIFTIKFACASLRAKFGVRVNLGAYSLDRTAKVDREPDC